MRRLVPRQRHLHRQHPARDQHCYQAREEGRVIVDPLQAGVGVEQSDRGGGLPGFDLASW